MTNQNVLVRPVAPFELGTSGYMVAPEVPERDALMKLEREAVVFPGDAKQLKEPEEVHLESLAEVIELTCMTVTPFAVVDPGVIVAPSA